MPPFNIPLITHALINEQETKQKLADFIVSADRFSMGEQCKRFEESFAKKQGTNFAVMVNSGSSANLGLIQVLLNTGKLKKGDRVGISALTWSTNVAPLIQLGLVPVAIDCSPDTLNVSSETLAPHIDSLQALFITNVLGYCDDLDAITSQCKEHDVLFFEDNCESLGSEAFVTRLGNFGIASTFSFFLGHHLSTLEGGMICTDDQDLYDHLLMVRSHGWARNLSPEKMESLRTQYNVDPFYEPYTFYTLGYNIRPTEIGGFLGNDQLPHWDKIIETREQNFKAIQPTIENNELLSALQLDHMDVISSFAIPVICKDRKTMEQYRQKFAEAGVEIRPIISGNITQQPIYKEFGDQSASCPNAQAIHENGFYFGNNTDLTDDHLETLKKLLK